MTAQFLELAGVLIAVMAPKTSVESEKARRMTAKKSTLWKTWPK